MVEKDFVGGSLLAMQYVSRTALPELADREQAPSHHPGRFFVLKKLAGPSDAA
jgi:hypothetical protein